MIDSNKIREIASAIATKFNPDKIFLFGSYANGTQQEDSDVDLLIIQDTDLPMQQRGFDIRMSLLGSMIPYDILIYTNEEFEQEKNKSYSFLHSAMKHSKLLYERSN
jgi:predicted nucleotidyltransferase